MIQDYIIDIVGKQNFEKDNDTVTVTTLGHYTEKSTGRYITYKEYDTEDPDNKHTSIVKIEGDNRVTITRTGTYNSKLILERDRRHQCHYATVAGDLMIGIFTNKMNINIDKNGGVLELGYTVDFNSDLVSENEIKISLKKAQTDNYMEKDGI
ncbi:MAG TPA: DUF1934 domain-containing protein [Clostridiales bacterium]|nr:DUF1934 domain-containing protein [Clostridiales bacterium]